MKIKALFYDFDGVIKESTQIKTAAFYSLYLPYGKDIAERAKQHHIENGGVSRYEKFKLYHSNFLNVELDEEGVAELAKQFSAIVLEKVIACDYVVGALNAIKILSDQYDQYIVTGTPQKEIDYIVKALEIDSFFKKVCGSPDTKITISQQLLDTTGLNADEVVFIGDATTDYKAAQHFNFKFILREHPENKTIFESIDCIKLDDLTELAGAIEK